MKKVDSLQDETVDLIKRLNKVSEDQMHSRADETQEYIKEVHNFQIDEMKNFKGCHTQYLNSSAQLDKKIATVIGIEANNIGILKQLRNLNEIVSELT